MSAGIYYLRLPTEMQNGRRGRSEDVRQGGMMGSLQPSCGTRRRMTGSVQWA